MLPRSKNVREDTSTPKRRRLGTARISGPKLQISDKKANISLTVSPIPRLESPSDKNDDPPLPCNQIEFLCDSGNTSGTLSDIPCSPCILECSELKNEHKWESLDVSKGLHNITNLATEIVKELDEINDMSDELFNSKLEQETSLCEHVNNTLLSAMCEQHFRENIEDSFDAINQSIHKLNKDTHEIDTNDDKNSLFETKDSFLLDIKESGILVSEKPTNPKIHNEIPSKKTCLENCNKDQENFYGLPIITKSLFKTFRNIEKFYDWQEECLSLPAVKERRNLIYALPTSGGKTLVAEVLMLREVLCRRKNALFILPFVAIVQEKIWSLSPFAVKLEFLVEEYAAGKGHLPPKKRRKKNSIYIATIEKGLALIRSLIEENRLEELGLIVVDELHLIGEPGRGATLETLLTTVLYADKGIQIVGMSATIGNLPDVGGFLRAEVFQREFRPVELVEYVKLGDMLHRLAWSEDGVEVTPHRQLAFDYSAAGVSLDPDLLGGLVAEVVPRGSCLVFCPTKRNCENVAALLCKLQRREMAVHRSEERRQLAAALRGEGAGGELQQCARAGLAFHHAGLSADERALLEHAFRSGVISVLCCTSTLAAGVNLPASRVIIRAPRVGREFLSLAAYRQMAGRAGRAGVCDTGESIIICEARDWLQLRSVLSGGLSAARSMLLPHVPELLLSAVALNLAHTRVTLKDLLSRTLLAVAKTDSPIDIKQVCDKGIHSLLLSGALEVINRAPESEDSRMGQGDCVVYNDSQLVVSQLGRAAIKGCMDLSMAKQLQKDLEVASRSLVVMGSLHLLYLVTPHGAAGIRPDLRHYYSLYSALDEEGLQTARILGISEMNAVRMMTGKLITKVPESVLYRFYLAMMLHDLWKQQPFPEVANKYCIPRGTVQSVMSSAAAFAMGAQKFCEQIAPLWPFRALFAELAPRLQHCAAPELLQLMELPAVKKARALQLVRAGYKRVEDVARASADDLVTALDHLSRAAATHLISAARMSLIEKVENLRAEAEDVMEELNM